MAQSGACSSGWQALACLGESAVFGMDVVRQILLEIHVNTIGLGRTGGEGVLVVDLV